MEQAWTAEDQSRQNEQLQLVLDRIRSKTQNQVSSLAIFDLDGTLFDNRARTVYILREIADHYEDRLPQLSAAMDGFQNMSIIQYGVRDTLDRIGVRDEAERSFIQEQWAKRFFTDDYQRFDIPLPGAKSYVCQVHEAGATVIYLTGRDVNMLVGLTDSLRMCGFPVGIVGTMMLTKKAFEEEDEVFKRNVGAYLKRLGRGGAVFENEPANSNLLQAAFPDASSLFVLTQHRPDAPALNSGIHKIRDFRIRR